jgi:hypothetical protein
MKILPISQFRINLAKQTPDSAMLPQYPMIPTGSSVVCPSLKFFKEWHVRFQNKLARVGLYTQRAKLRTNPCGLFSSEAVNYLNHSVAMVGDDYVAAMFQARIKVHPDKSLLGIPPEPVANMETRHCNCLLMLEDEQIYFYEPQETAFRLSPFGDAIHYCDLYDIIM